MLTLVERIQELLGEHGSYRAAGRAIGVDAAYLFHLANGERVRPSSLVLKKMGLREVVAYERLKTSASAKTPDGTRSD